MKHPKQTLLLAIMSLLVACSLASAQAAVSPTTSKGPESRTKLIAATQQYKASSKELLTVQENEVTKAAAKLDELRMLVSEGLVARAELEDSEKKLDSLRAQVQATQKQIAESDNMIADIKAEEELAKSQTAKPVKLVSKQYGAISTTATMLRYNGPTAWSVSGLNEIRAFFSAKFGRSLPTSAVGQSATHDRLGYDHHNAVDVALQPDSFEGKVLINYLQGQGIPFLAFLGAIPGVATGPHIHIGSPSRRLS